MNHKLIITILVLAHVICGVVLAFFAKTGSSILFAAYFGLFLSQPSLLGIWVGLATIWWPVRLIGFLFGSVYLGGQFCNGFGQWNPVVFSFVVLSVIVVTCVMLIVRQFYVQLERTTVASLLTRVGSSRFSVRNLMLLMLFLSITLTTGQLLQKYSGPEDQLVQIFVSSALSVSVGIASAWAMLGGKNLFFRSSVVFLIGLIMACIPSIAWESPGWWYWYAILIVESACLLGSLYVVRQCGFRFVRH